MRGRIWQLCKAVTLLLVFLVTACDSQQEQLYDQLIVDVSVDSTTLNVPLPQRLRSIEDIDPAAITAIATVAGVETQLQLNEDGRFAGQITVPAQSQLSVRIDFSELYSGQQLILARVEKSVSTSTSDTSLSLFREDYDYNSFDFDGDSASNMLEREYNTSPLDAEQAPELVRVEVFAQPPAALVAAGYTNYQFNAALAGQTGSGDASAGQFRQTFTVVRQDSLTVDMILLEQTTGQSLTIGQQTRQIPGSQFAAQGGALVVFNGASWNLDNDQDGDGISNANELIAGTDLFSAPVSNRIPYMVTFDVPAEITSTGSVFATLTIDGQSIALTRTGNTYTGSSTAVTGTTVSLDAQIRDTYQGAALLLATFAGQALPVANGNLQLTGFSTQHDDDNDGAINHLELAQGTDPFNATVQCNPVTENVLANLSDDAYIQNSGILDNERLQVDIDRRTILIRFQYDQSQGEVTAARLNLTVGNDAGDGLLTVSAVSGFDWSDQGESLTVPASVLAGSADNDWEQGSAYSFALNPDVISDDFTLIIQQSNGNDVGFQSSDTVAPPTLELAVERCE